MKALIPILIGLLVVGCGKGNQTANEKPNKTPSKVDDNNSTKTNPDKELTGEDVVGTQGLYPEDGKLMRSGEEFRAMGINYNDCFLRLIENKNHKEYAEGFRTLKEQYDIPFIRFNAGAFSHTGWKLYTDNPQEYFRRFDLIVQAAEKENLGLIPSLFWYVVTMPDLAGEPLSALGDPNSKCRTFMRKYIRDVVGRYKDSPAIWGWEVGNEWMLYADLPKYDHLPKNKIGSKEKRTKADKMLRPMLRDAYVDFYKRVREIDPQRIIVTGDSIPRPSAWHNRNKDSWGADSKEQWFETFRADTPACYEVASLHLYEEAEKSYFKKKDLTIESVVSEIVEDCKKNKKIVWCGELGMPSNKKTEKEMFFRMMNAVEQSDIELSAIWNFKPRGKFQPDWDISPTNERSYMLDAVKAFNKRHAKGDWR